MKKCAFCCLAQAKHMCSTPATCCLRSYCLVRQEVQEDFEEVRDWISPWILEKKRKEKTTPFGVSLMRSQELYRASQALSPYSVRDHEHYLRQVAKEVHVKRTPDRSNPTRVVSGIFRSQYNKTSASPGCLRIRRSWQSRNCTG